MERLEEIEKELNTHYDMIRELKAKVFPLEKEKEQILTKRMKQLVGLCFVDKDRNYYMIVNTPQRPMTMMPAHINFYQIPVYKIDNKTRELTYETFHSAAHMSDNPVERLKTEVSQFITQEAFRMKAKLVVQDVIERMRRMLENE